MRSFQHHPSLNYKHPTTEKALQNLLKLAYEQPQREFRNAQPIAYWAKKWQVSTRLARKRLSTLAKYHLIQNVQLTYLSPRQQLLTAHFYQQRNSTHDRIHYTTIAAKAHIDSQPPGMVLLPAQSDTHPPLKKQGKTPKPRGFIWET